MRLLLAALLIATPVAAQTPPAPPETPAPEGRGAEARQRLLAADTDKDGQWTQSEWLGAGRRERGFQMLDADKNGFVTQDELRAGMARFRRD